MRELVERLAKIPTATARRLYYFAMGYSLKRVPTSDNDEYIDVAYLSWWFEDRESYEKAKPILDILEFGRKFDYDPNIEGKTIYVYHYTIKASEYFNDCPSPECSATIIELHAPGWGIKAKYNRLGLLAAWFDDNVRTRLLSDGEFLLEIADLIDAVARGSMVGNLPDDYTIERNRYIALIEAELHDALRRRPKRYEFAEKTLEPKDCKFEDYCVPGWRGEECGKDLICLADPDEAREVINTLNEKLKIIQFLFPP